MTTRAFRCKVRLDLSDVDRNIFVQRTMTLAQQPDESDEHVLLRFLAFVFFYHQDLNDTQGFTLLTEPDLAVRDLLGELSLWIECGLPPIKRVVRGLGKHKDARFVALIADPDEADDLRRELRSARARNADRLEIYLVPPLFMERLESVAGRSMKWSATLNEGLLYLDCDGQLLEGKLERL